MLFNCNRLDKNVRLDNVWLDPQKCRANPKPCIKALLSSVKFILECAKLATDEKKHACGSPCMLSIYKYEKKLHVTNFISTKRFGSTIFQNFEESYYKPTHIFSYKNSITN